jgi:hypothetical protein
VTSGSEANVRDDRHIGLLWIAFFTGPFAWTFNQGAGYAMMKPACAGSTSYVLWLIAAAAFAMVAGGAWTGGRWLLQPGSTSDRTSFLASLAVAFNILIGVLILTAALPQFFLSPCE